MKKLILVILFALGATMTANAQWYDFYCELPEGMYFSGKQYHYEDYSVLSTNRDNQYLVVRSNGYSSLSYIPPLEVVTQDAPRGIKIYSYAPYPSGSSGYWYISSDRGFFLVNEKGSWSRTSAFKYCGDKYHYSITPRVRCLSFLNWHVCAPDRRDYYYNRNHNHSRYASSYRDNYQNHRYENNDRFRNSRNNYDRRPTSGNVVRKSGNGTRQAAPVTNRNNQDSRRRR